MTTTWYISPAVQRGAIHLCGPQGVTHKFLDLSALALGESSLNLPFSQGFRSQVLALKQITPETRGRFFRPAAEAVQSIRILLTGLSKPLKDHLPALAQMQIEPVHAMLVYLAFEEQHHDYVHPGIQAAINKNVLTLSSNL